MCFLTMTHFNQVKALAVLLLVYELLNVFIISDVNKCILFVINEHGAFIYLYFSVFFNLNGKCFAIWLKKLWWYAFPTIQDKFFI